MVGPGSSATPDNILPRSGGRSTVIYPVDQQLGLAIVASLTWIGRNNPDLGLTAFGTQSVPFAEGSADHVRTAILILAAYDQWYLGDLDQARHLGELTLEGGVEAVIEDPLDPISGCSSQSR